MCIFSTPKTMHPVRHRMLCRGILILFRLYLFTWQIIQKMVYRIWIMAAKISFRKEMAMQDWKKTAELFADNKEQERTWRSNKSRSERMAEPITVFDDFLNSDIGEQVRKFLGTLDAKLAFRSDASPAKYKVWFLSEEGLAYEYMQQSVGAEAWAVVDRGRDGIHYYNCIFDSSKNFILELTRIEPEQSSYDKPPILESWLITHPQFFPQVICQALAEITEEIQDEGEIEYESCWTGWCFLDLYRPSIPIKRISHPGYHDMLDAKVVQWRCAKHWGKKSRRKCVSCRTYTEKRDQAYQEYLARTQYNHTRLI